MMNARIINDHIVELNTRRFVFLSDLAECVEEEPITKFHDVGLVHTCHFL